MSLTNPNYPLMEIALSTVSYPQSESGHERKLAGDIVACRRANIGAGLRELKRYIWMRVEGLEEDDWDALKMPVIDWSIKQKYDKRRFCVPLERLSQFDASFDYNKAIDTDLIYQPFCPVDETTGLWLYNPTPINVMGLIYDKETGIYL